MIKPEEGMDAVVATKALDALEEAAKEVEDLAWPALREAARAYAADWDDYRDPARQARARDRLEDAARDFVAAEDHEHAIGFCDACCRPMTGSEVDAAIALGRDPLAIRVDSGPGRAAKTAPRPKAQMPAPQPLGERNRAEPQGYAVERSTPEGERYLCGGLHGDSSWWGPWRDPFMCVYDTFGLADEKAEVGDRVVMVHGFDERRAYSIEKALSEFAAEVKAKVTANTRAAGYVELHHLYGLLDHAIAKGTP
jgi:hypothetical protein